MTASSAQLKFRISAMIVAAVAVYLFGNAAVALWDRDEPRYAQTSRQMFQSGDWVVPMLLDQPREKKPVFIYWCQAAAMACVRFDEVFAARLPSVIGVGLTLVLLATLLWRTIGPRRAFWTTLIFATSGLTMAAAKMCITDGVLVLFVTGAQICLYALWRGRWSWLAVVSCGVFVGLGMLTKGPVVLGVMGTTLCSLLVFRLVDRSSGVLSPALSMRTWRWSKVAVILIVAAGIYAVWGIAIEKRRPGYHVRTIKSEVLDRAAKPQEGHTGPPGYYLLTVWGTYLPWSILLPAIAINAWRKRRIPPIQFAIAAVIGPWVMFEIAATKLVHYFLPVFPALAFLTADVVVRSARLRKLSMVAGIVMLVAVAVAYGLVLPRIPQLQIAPRVADVLIREGATHPGDAIMIDYKETSLAFYQGGTIRPEGDSNFLVNTPAERWPRWIVMTDAIWKRMPDAVKNRLEILESIRGLNYAGKDADKRHDVTVHVLRKR